MIVDAHQKTRPGQDDKTKVRIQNKPIRFLTFLSFPWHKLIIWLMVSVFSLICVFIQPQFKYQISATESEIKVPPRFFEHFYWTKYIWQERSCHRKPEIKKKLSTQEGLWSESDLLFRPVDLINNMLQV